MFYNHRTSEGHKIAKIFVILDTNLDTPCCASPSFGAVHNKSPNIKTGTRRTMKQPNYNSGSFTCKTTIHLKEKKAHFRCCYRHKRQWGLPSLREFNFILVDSCTVIKPSKYRSMFWIVAWQCQLVHLSVILFFSCFLAQKVNRWVGGREAGKQF